MSRWHSWLRSATDMISGYKGNEPFPFFAKQYFSRHKQAGSKDRRHISQLCYCYFRAAKAFRDQPVERAILLGYFLCSTEPSEQLAATEPGWNEKTHLSIREKLAFLDLKISLEDFFPAEMLSDTIDKEEFLNSIFIQPDLFLRLRPGYEDLVKKKLESAGISYKEISASCLSLPNSSRIDNVIELDKEAVVQDLSSQRIGELLSGAGVTFSKAWDCCAGSGGKSILLKDIFPGIALTVSDIRPAILQNLAKRFYAAGISRYKCITVDLVKADLGTQDEFDCILADLPCTGSGTWGRSPEQLFYFKQQKIIEYTALQKKILTKVIPHLLPGGYLVYITCSVFKKENEEMIAWINQESGLRTIKMEVLKGYHTKADTLFATLLEKPLP
ncbi:MAG TPA: hypothetical protein VLJ68_05780 [Chitinophagaceae bacterium]|nr:hypothetical protein [Chitinophagaceae bacterium]